MTVIQMDKMSAPSQERARRLYEKNIELEGRRRKSAQARLPSDPNIWQQMRENYEAIILEDHAFSEQHNIEHALWQLHYKKIEELRALYNAAQASSGSNTSHSAKGPPRPDRITKIRLQFKTFLSEASGFYHDLIMKIRSKYGLPLGYFAEESDSRLFLEKDGKKYAEMKKGLISCHRCLIYLGDLARYKGSYGDSGSRVREYAAASSYYLQAASVWPSIGNPHHQLAILASYNGDDMVTIYRYFRSLAVDNPCSTARDNLIVAFEKNRQSFSQLLGDVKLSTVLSSGKGREPAKLELNDADKESSTDKGLTSSTQDARKYISTCFVRLNGILFTRTSLETFSEVLSLVSAALCELLFFGPEEEMNFGADFFENSLFFVRLVSILIFTTHNAKRENEGQTYAEIVQRATLVKNAYAAAFEITGHILKRCEQLHDPSSSYLLPCILVFMEWLACCLDVVTDSDIDKKQETLRSSFWNYCISLLNKLLADRTLLIEDDGDDTCFNNMTKYEEGETGNQLALMEDFELRGFLPLIPAQAVLDFSKKPSLGSEIKKEKLFRLKRIFAASKVLMGAVKINQEKIWYDSKVRKFIIGGDTEISDGNILPSSTIPPKASDLFLENGDDDVVNLGIQLPKNRPYVDGEEEDEEIVFKPSTSEKQTDVTALTWAPFGVVKPEKTASAIHKPFEVVEPEKSTSIINQPFYGASVSGSISNPLWGASGAFLQSPISVGNPLNQDSHSMKPHTSFFSMEEENSLARSFNEMRLPENGHVMKPGMQESIESNPAFYGVQGKKSLVNTGAAFYSQAKPPEIVNPLPRTNGTTSSEFTSENLSVNQSLNFPTGLRKSPVSRPARHLGPPPGFSNVPKQDNEQVPGPDLNGQHRLLEDYSWLDGYKLSSNQSSGLNSAIHASHANSLQIDGSAEFGSVSNPFPGMQVPMGKKGRQEYNSSDLMKLLQEKQLQRPQQIVNRNMQFAPQSAQNQGSIWTGRYFV